jgi:hypothetical protein
MTCLSTFPEAHITAGRAIQLRLFTGLRPSLAAEKLNKILLLREESHPTPAFQARNSIDHRAMAKDGDLMARSSTDA